MTESSSFSGPTLAIIRRLFADHARLAAGAYLLAGLLMAVAAACTALTAYLLKPVLNLMVEADGFNSLRSLSFYVAFLFLLRGAVTYFYQVLLARTGNRIVARVQTRLFEHLLHQNLSYFKDRHSSEFINRLSLAATGIRDTLQILITSVGRDILTLLGLMIVMFVQDALMALVALFLLPLGAYRLSRLIKRVRLFAKSSFDGSTRILRIMQEALQGMRMVKSFNLEPLLTGRMLAAISEVELSANRMAAGMAVASPLADIFGGLAIAGVILYGSWHVTGSQGDAGSFVSFIAALLMAYEPAKRLARLHLEIQNGLVGAKLIYDLFDSPAAEKPRAEQRHLAVDHGQISFENVTFSYRPNEKVLADLSFVVEPNATTALVGLSGGGKSTIISLIQRFYDPNAGRILIDGHDIAAVDLGSLRDKTALVAQDVFLFQGTIEENIALGRPGASRMEIIAAAKKAFAHEFIMSFHAGYGTSVGEQGLQLSAGQRQRIEVARAILKDAPILLLDEPTAALDPDSERAVQKALDAFRRGRTTLVVAHRLRTIVDADRICVIGSGRALETGTHAELMAKGGHYRMLFTAQ